MAPSAHCVSCAVLQKIANGFPTEWEAKLYAYIGSVIETTAADTISALEVIHLRHRPECH